MALDAENSYGVKKVLAGLFGSGGGFLGLDRCEPLSDDLVELRIRDEFFVDGANACG